MGNSTSEVKSISIRNTHAFSGISPSGQTLLFPEGSKLRIKNYGKYKRKEVSIKDPVRLSIQHRASTDYSCQDKATGGFFISDLQFPLDQEITNLIYDPSFQLQTSHQLISRNSNKKIKEQIEIILSSMERMGRRLGCSKKVLQKMLLELTEVERLRQSTLTSHEYLKIPSTGHSNEEVAVRIRRASVSQKIVEEDSKNEERLSTLGGMERRDKDRLQIEDTTAKEPLLLHHAYTQPVKANTTYENIEEDDSESSSCVYKETSQPLSQQATRTKGFRSMFSIQAGSNLPFLLIEVQNAEIHDSVVLHGCC